MTYYGDTGDTRLANRRATPPIGSIIAFYDFGTDDPLRTPLTYNSATWELCDGRTVTINGVSRTLPDLSGRYLIGYGTENGTGTIDTDGVKDLGSAAHSLYLTGNAVRTYDFTHTHNHSHVHGMNGHQHTYAHTHTLNAHYHPFPHTHTITFPNHYHEWLRGAYNAQTQYYWDIDENLKSNPVGGGSYRGFDNDNAMGPNFNGTYRTESSGGKTLTSSSTLLYPNTNPDSTSMSFPPPPPPLTLSAGPSYDNSATASTGATDPALGVTDIRPRSIKVKFLMRIA